MDPLGERLPYVVTLLFAAVGWGVTHTVDRVLQSPIVEYQTKVIAGPKQSDFVVTIQNVSLDRVYKNVSFIFLLPGKDLGEFVSAQKIATPPAWEGDDQPMVTAKSVQFDLPSVHPGWEVVLAAQFTESITPVVRLAGADPTLRLVRPSLETFLLKNEVKVIVCAILLWALLLIALVGLRSTRTWRKRKAK